MSAVDPPPAPHVRLVCVPWLRAARALALALHAVAALTLVTACDAVPRDCRGSLDAARARGALRAGIDGDDAVAERERACIEEFAGSLGLGVAWTRGRAEDLLLDLEEGELDLVAAALRPKSEHEKSIGLSRPWRPRPDAERVFGVAKGENEILWRLDRHLVEREGAR